MVVLYTIYYRLKRSWVKNSAALNPNLFELNTELSEKDKKVIGRLYKLPYVGLSPTSTGVKSVSPSSTSGSRIEDDSAQEAHVCEQNTSS